MQKSKNVFKNYGENGKLLRRHGSPCYPFLWQKTTHLEEKTTTENILPYHFYQVYFACKYYY